ncbi:Uncharacterised protein [Vibrio cholerae]|nr:Uncharacterised protein [Vibrio cholerae]CSC92676.1 Uncharacterised protein [Vibrio cholerae]
MQSGTVESSWCKGREWGFTLITTQRWVLGNHFTRFFCYVDGLVVVHLNDGIGYIQIVTRAPHHHQCRDAEIIT